MSTEKESFGQLKKAIDENVAAALAEMVEIREKLYLLKLSVEALHDAQCKLAAKLRPNDASDSEIKYVVQG